MDYSPTKRSPYDSDIIILPQLDAQVYRLEGREWRLKLEPSDIISDSPEETSVVDSTSPTPMPMIEAPESQEPDPQTTSVFLPGDPYAIPDDKEVYVFIGEELRRQQDGED